LEQSSSCRLSFSSDYLEGAHPAIIERLVQTNLMQTPGYGSDAFCEAAREKIRAACACPDAAVYFLVGGTQANATAIDALLASYQGVIAPESGHINVHEAGTIEFGGHKVLALPQKAGKIRAEDIEVRAADFEADENREHMVAPAMVYLSQPTECGTLYSLAELRAINAVCRAHGLLLYVDGARLAYALACPENDVTLADLAALTDVFYIGGTKCGALFGEAVVVPQPGLIPHFLTIMKQHGALLAKGRLLGLQFDTLFADELYLHIGESAIMLADRIRKILREQGYQLFLESPTNQVLVVLENNRMHELAEQVEFSYWEKFDADHTVVRFATSWATRSEDVDALEALLSRR